MDSYALIVADAQRQLDAIKPEIDVLCEQAREHIERRYRDALNELRRSFNLNRSS